MDKKMIIFDLDGTLVDTRAFIFEALREFMPSVKHNDIADIDIPQLSNTRSIHFLKVLGVPLWRAPKLLRFVQKNMEAEIESMTFAPGMEEVLTTLKKQGFIIGLITLNSKQNTALFLKKYHGTYFDIKKAGIFPFGKHRVIRKMAKKMHVDIKNVYYVGDETRDVVAAKRAGVHSIAVTWGINSRKILTTLFPDVVIDNPAEILNFVKI